MSEALAIIWLLFSHVWPVVLFFMILPFVGSTLQFWRQEVYKNAIQWTTLEIRIPREIKRTPKAMEQVLTAFHGLGNYPDTFSELYIDGEITEWISLEIVSLGGGVHYYIRFPSKKRNIIEANIFSYYPDVELAEVDDYVSRFPQDVAEMKRWGYEMFGTELVLKKDPAYPIRSYVDFETMMEEAQMDPASALLEMLGKAKPEEMVGIQFLISPAGEGWQKAGRKVAAEMRDGKSAGSSAAKHKLKISFEHGPLPIFDSNASSDKKEDAPKTSRSPGETDLLKAVETNLSMPGFHTMIRMVYFSPQATFFDGFIKRGVVSSFNQYSSSDLNGFKTNGAVETKVNGYFAKVRSAYRKQRMLWNYRKRLNPVEPWMGQLITSHFFHRNFNSKRMVLNTRALATLYHPPTYLVLTAPHIQRVDSRKAGPPAGLAIFGEEADIERFK
jgi:hypothetical protein